MHRTETVVNQYRETFSRERDSHNRICCADCHAALPQGQTGIAFTDGRGDRIIGDCCFSRMLAERYGETAQ
jgi:hypothetical protein